MFLQKQNLQRLLTSEPGNESTGAAVCSEGDRRTARTHRRCTARTHRHCTAETLVSQVKTKMKSELIYVSMLTVMSALLVTNSAKPEKAWRWTTASPRTNLQGKMFTLSANRGGISFYPPYFSPSPSSWPATWSYPSPTTRALYPTSNTPYYHTKPTTTRAYYPTRKPPYYTTTNYPWTTPPPTRSVSVCLRYLVDYTYSLFTLSPASRNALQVGLSGGGYQLNTKYSYQNLYLRPNIKIWSNIGPDFWTRVCFIVDSVNNVAQVFNGSNMSIRKMLPFQYAWSGEPVIEFSGFDGQVTDIQVWDYPLRYREVFSYMTGGVYMPYHGSVLTWSYLSYTSRGKVLLEDAYEQQARQPISSSEERRRYRPKGEKKKTKKYMSISESKTEQL